MTTPLAHATHQAINAAINAAITADERVRALIGAARAAETPEEWKAAVVEGAELLARSEAGTTLGIGACVQIVSHYASIEFPVGPDGAPQPVVGSVRVPGIPGMGGRPLWVLTNDRDVAAMREAMEPGQVWIRSDLVRSDDWPTVRALASDAAARMLGLVRTPGRRKGSTSVARRALLSAIRARPDMTDEAIDDLGVNTGVWGVSLGDYTLVRRRVARARMAAAKAS